MQPSITTFIFDCFGVVCAPVLNQWYIDHRVSKGFIDEALLGVFHRFDLGQLTEEDIADYFSRYDGVQATREEIMQQIDGYLRLDRELVSSIKRLRERGFKIALLSNANATFFHRLVYKVYPDFQGLFDEIVISSEVGMVKPNQNIYQYTLKKLQKTPEEALFIDDSQANVEAATELGMKGFVYQDRATFLRYLKDELGIGLE